MLKSIESKEDKICIPVSDNVFIKREKDTKDMVNGIHIDTSYDRMLHVIQTGIVKYVPKRLSAWMDTEMELQPGDKVYCHHFVGEIDNCIEIYGEKLNLLKYNMYYARVRDGQIHMLMNFILVDYVEEDEKMYKTKSGLWKKPNAEKAKQIGIVRHVNSKSKDYGINVGDKVMFIENADYEIEIEGKTMYRMLNKDVLMRIEGDELPIAKEIEGPEDEQMDMDKVYNNMGKLN